MTHLKRFAGASGTTAQARNATFEIRVALGVLEQERAKLIGAIEPRVQADTSVGPDDLSRDDTFALKSVDDSLHAYQRNAGKAREFAWVSVVEEGYERQDSRPRRASEQLCRGHARYIIKNVVI